MADKGKDPLPIFKKSIALVKKYKGSFSGEHGDGIVRAEFIPLMIGDQNYQLLRRIKKAFDHHGILNPGKAIPTLSRCAEFGAMHVHAGEERFPHLDRF